MPNLKIFTQKNLSRPLLAMLILSSITIQESLNIQHYNDVYDVHKSSRFLQRMMDEKKSRPDPLVLFSGDIISPSVVSNEFKGRQFLKFFELIGLQYAVPGNHENDYGYDHFKKLISEFKGPKWMMSNMKYDNGKKVIFDIPEYLVVDKNGLKIGLFGLGYKKAITRKGLVGFDKIEFEDTKAAAVRVSKLLKETHKCDLVFLISHIENVEDEAILEDPANFVDVIFGGHEHIFYLKKINNRLLIKSGADFDVFSSIKLDVIKKTGAFTTLHYSPTASPNVFCDTGCPTYEYLMDELEQLPFHNFKFALDRADKMIEIEVNKILIPENYPEHEDAKSYLKTDVNKNFLNLLEPVLFVKNHFDARETQFSKGESMLSDFFSDFIRAYSGTQIGCTLNKMFKSEMILKAGSTPNMITIRKIFPYPDKHQIFVYEMTAEQIKMLLEASLAKFPEDVEPFMVCAGLSYKFRTHPNTGEQKVELTLGQVNENNKYEVAASENLTKEFKDFFNNNPGIGIVKKGSFIQEIVEKFLRSPGATGVEDFKAFKQACPACTLDTFVDPQKYAQFVKTEYGQGYARLKEDEQRRLRYFTLAESVKIKGTSQFYEIEFGIKGRAVQVNKTLVLV